MKAQAPMVGGVLQLTKENTLIISIVASSVFWFEMVCQRSARHILLRVDNITALSYINSMGNVQYPNLSDMTRTIYMALV